MFTGADGGCNMLEEIPADIEFSRSNCDAVKRREPISN